MTAPSWWLQVRRACHGEARSLPCDTGVVACHRSRRRRLSVPPPRLARPFPSLTCLHSHRWVPPSIILTAAESKEDGSPLNGGAAGPAGPLTPTAASVCSAFEDILAEEELVRSSPGECSLAGGVSLRGAVRVAALLVTRCFAARCRRRNPRFKPALALHACVCNRLQVANLVTTAVGAGMLALPCAVQKTGIVLGAALFALVAALTYASCSIIVR